MLPTMSEIKTKELGLWKESHWELFVNNTVWPTEQNGSADSPGRRLVKAAANPGRMTKQLQRCPRECLSGTTRPYDCTFQSWRESVRQMVGRRRQTEGDEKRRPVTKTYLFSLWRRSGWRGPGGPSLVVWTARSGPAWKQLKQQHKSPLRFWRRAPPPPKGHGRALAQLTRSSWRRGAWTIKTCTKSTSN